MRQSKRQKVTGSLASRLRATETITTSRSVSSGSNNTTVTTVSTQSRHLSQEAERVTTYASHLSPKQAKRVVRNRNNLADAQLNALQREFSDLRNPSLFATSPYRERVLSFLEPDHDLEGLMFHTSLRHLLDHEQKKLGFSCIEMKHQPCDGLFTSDEKDTRFRELLLRKRAEVEEGVEEGPDVGSLYFNLALSDLLSRKRNRENICYLENSPVSPDFIHHDAAAEGEVIYRNKKTDFPFTAIDFRLLENNELTKGPVPFNDAEKFVFKTVKSWGQDPSLLRAPLYQALTMKSFLKGTTESSARFCWKFPSLVQITGVQLKDPRSVAFGPADFFGDVEDKVWMATCDFLVSCEESGGDDSRTLHITGVWMEVVALLQTETYARQTVEAIEKLVLVPYHQKVRSISCLAQLNALPNLTSGMTWEQNSQLLRQSLQPAVVSRQQEPDHRAVMLK